MDKRYTVAQLQVEMSGLRETVTKQYRELDELRRALKDEREKIDLLNEVNRKLGGERDRLKAELDGWQAEARRLAGYLDRVRDCDEQDERLAALRAGVSAPPFEVVAERSRLRRPSVNTNQESDSSMRWREQLLQREGYGHD